MVYWKMRGHTAIEATSMSEAKQKYLDLSAPDPSVVAKDHDGNGALICRIERDTPEGPVSSRMLNR